MKTAMELQTVRRKPGEKKEIAKRVNIVSLRVVKESSLLYKERRIRSPHDSYNLIKSFLEDSDREMFVILSLDTKNQPTNIEVCHIGSLNASIVHPRECFKNALLSNANSVIAFHNHPSGDVSPSEQDLLVTDRLKEAGNILGIDLLDHIIIGDNSFISLKEKGYM